MLLYEVAAPGGGGGYLCIGELRCIKVREENFELGFYMGFSFGQYFGLNTSLFMRWGVGSFVAAIY